jgi:hypothetical protein
VDHHSGAPVLLLRQWQQQRQSGLRLWLRQQQLWLLLIEKQRAAPM